jgi:UDP-N-acetylmuramoyl-L-alanyl-D-glutamate--2,6-diaminopimelate ligase
MSSVCNIDLVPAQNVNGLAYLPEQVVPGALFFLLRGQPGGFACDAEARGACAIVREDYALSGIPSIRVHNARLAMAFASARYYGFPSRKMDVIGVTGTNGKGTTAHLIQQILLAEGVKTGLIGSMTGPPTTPEAPELHRRLADLVASDAQAVALEVSSHALAWHRVAGIRFRVAVLTQVDRDHLDFHRTMARYRATKALLFSSRYTSSSVVNTDDELGLTLLARNTSKITGYGLADARDLCVGSEGSSWRWDGVSMTTRQPGLHNVANCLAAATTARELGVKVDHIRRAVWKAPSLPGRFERIDEGQPFEIIVDYAHTPGALDGLLRTARMGHRKLVLVFGCQGERDHGKRPIMGAIAAAGADAVIVTADDSEIEDPLDIMEDIRAGFRSRERHVLIEPNRRQAIRTAISWASPGDVVVVAGRGSEPTLRKPGSTEPFDDRIVTREEVKRSLCRRS